MNKVGNRGEKTFLSFTLSLLFVFIFLFFPFFKYNIHSTKQAGRKEPPDVKEVIIPSLPITDEEHKTNGNLWLAPISKNYSLPSDYAPTLENVPLLGSGLLTKDTLQNLTALFNDAKKQNIDIRIISSYRSYHYQIQIFNDWINYEINKGFNRTQAEINANNYSARPGQSEHQLGTVVDIKCSTCGDFDDSQGNTNLYNYLKENAYKFGFVISYPDKKELTGYNYEPWHVRYIGINLATELFDRNYLENNNEYLEKFLMEKKLY